MSRVILGVDPGLTRCGIAVIDASSTRKVQMLAVDTLRTAPSQELSERLLTIADGVEELILKHKPSLLAIERVFSQANVRSVMGVAQISGVVMYLAKKHRIPVQMHTPTEVKAAVTGSGRAQKTQIGLAVTKILGLSEIPKPADSADALAIAICASWKGFGASPSTDTKQTKAQEAWAAAERVAKRKPKA